MKTEKHLLYWALIVSIFIACGYTIIANAAWVLGDDIQFLTTTAIGKTGVHGLIGAGNRMWPLGLWDYNFLPFVPFGYTPTAHYIWNTVTCLLALVFLLKLFWLISRKNYYKFSLVILLILCCFPGFCLVNLEVIFAERILLLALAVFIYCFIKGKQSQKGKYYVYASLCAVYATYCKEPIFGMFAVFAIVEAFFSKNKTRATKFFLLGLGLNSLIYIVCYYVFAYSANEESYLNCRSHCDLMIFLNSKLLLLISVLSVIRLYFVIKGKNPKYLVWDGFLFASVSYVAAYLLLGIDADYYFVPAVVMCVPALYYWCCHCYTRDLRWAKHVYFLMLFLCSVDGAASTKNTIKHLHFKRSNDVAVLSSIPEKSKLSWVYDKTVKGTYGMHISCKFRNFKMFFSYLKKLIFWNNTPIFASDSVLFYPEENEELVTMHDIYNDILKQGFSIIANIDSTNIFSCSEPKIITSDFYYRFRQGVIDPCIRFNCFKNFSEKIGATANVSNPSVKVKLLKKHNYKVCIRVKLEKDNTFGTNSIETKWQINGHLLETRKISVSDKVCSLELAIPNALIADDGSVNIECVCPNLHSEKDLGISDKNLRKGIRFLDIKICFI